MSVYATTTEIQSYFKTQWSLAGRVEEVAYQGYKDEGLSLSSGVLPWVRLTRDEGITRQISLQNKPIDRSTGVIMCQCFQREKTGTAIVEQMSDVIINMFRNFKINGASSGLIRSAPAHVPTARIVGIDPKGWFQINVVVDYIRDLRRT